MKNKSEKKLKSNGNAAEASAAGLSKTGILAEAIGGISDEFVKAAEDPEAAFAAAKKRRVPGSLRYVFISAACLAVLATVFFSIYIGNSIIRRGERQTGEKVSPDEGYAELTFTDTDGGYAVSGISNPEGYAKLKISVPPVHNGKAVVEYDPAASISGILPRMLTEAAFDRITESFAESINAQSDASGKKRIDNWRDYLPIAKRSKLMTDSNNEEWYSFLMFIAYYPEKDPAEILSSRETAELIKRYPQCADGSRIYVLIPDATPPELNATADILKKYVPSYTFEMKLADETDAGYYQWLVYDRLNDTEKTVEAWNGIVSGGKSAVRPSVYSGIITEISLPDSVVRLPGTPLAGTCVRSFRIPSGVCGISGAFFAGAAEGISVTYADEPDWYCTLGGYGKYFLSDLTEPGISGHSNLWQYELELYKCKPGEKETVRALSSYFSQSLSSGMPEPVAVRIGSFEQMQALADFVSGSGYIRGNITDSSYAGRFDVGYFDGAAAIAVLTFSGSGSRTYSFSVKEEGGRLKINLVAEHYFYETCDVARFVTLIPVEKNQAGLEIDIITSDDYSAQTYPVN